MNKQSYELNKIFLEEISEGVKILEYNNNLAYLDSGSEITGELHKINSQIKRLIDIYQFEK